ncbi:MAG: class F sortase [Frankiaceae bacterium]|nr:class F sortase [Frankiaceae bacterium]
MTTHQQRQVQPASAAPAASSSSPPSVQASAPAPSSTATVIATPLAASAPTRLVIPSIKVSTPLLILGQAADGSVAVPPPGPHYDQAGWYRYSPTPGSIGPAVLVGHIDSKQGGPSVFFRLGELRPRDTIRIARADGSIAVFAVDDVRRFRKADFPTALVYGNTAHAALRLITCGGPFDKGSGHYLDNVVVTASLVSSA